MKIDDITQASLLYDFYGQLLSKRQKECMELYYEENLSLSEIAEEFQISRQGVSDALKNAVKALNDYEAKLGLVAKLQQTNKAIENIDNIIDELIEDIGENDQNMLADTAVDKLKTVKAIIDKLED